MINVVSAPKPLGASNLNLLRKVPGQLSGQNLGGRFALPIEFDQGKYAAAFYQKGQQVMAMQQDQVIVGTEYATPGWQVWKYPGVAEKKKERGKVDKAATAEDKAGRPHEVTSQSKDGATFVLMFRPLELQRQVNRAYADLSREAMINEVRGDRPAVTSGDGILTNAMLKSVGERDIEADREFEESGAGRTAAIEENELPTGGGKARRTVTTVHR